MFVVSRPAAAVRVIGLAAVLGLIAGCEPGSPLRRAGVALALPPAWQPVPATTWPVPGTPIAAWSGPGGSSLVVYAQAIPTMQAPRGAAETILTGLGNRLANLPGMNEAVRRIESWGGFTAARLEVVAPGTGDALAATGMGAPIAPKGKTLVSTRRVVVGIPSTETIFLVWHAPESAHEQLEAQIETIRTGFQFRPRRPATSSY